MSGNYSPQPPREVRSQSESQYESIWEAHADARRALYPYETPPWEDRKPYNMWEDMADRLDPANAAKIIDLGTNDGYLYKVLRYKGFGGKFIGIDIEGKDLPAVDYIIRHQFPDADVEFLQGDAQNLRGIIPDSSTAKAVAAKIAYHVPKPGRLLSEMHRILEPGGRGFFSSRDITNQLDTWQMVRVVAHSQGFAFPQEMNSETGEFISGVPIERISVYSHFDIGRMRQSLSQSKKFRIVEEKVQDDKLWVPTTDVGWFDYSRVLESLLPYTISMRGLNRPTGDDLGAMSALIHGGIRQHFINSGLRNQKRYNLPMPCHISHVAQGFFEVEAIK
jgi:SAM-dependent methyltransferase